MQIMSIQTWCIINKNKCTDRSASRIRNESEVQKKNNNNNKNHDSTTLFFQSHGRVMLDLENKDLWFSWCRTSSWSPANRWCQRWWNLLLLVDKQKKKKRIIKDLTHIKLFILTSRTFRERRPSCGVDPGLMGALCFIFLFCLFTTRMIQQTHWSFIRELSTLSYI